MDIGDTCFYCVIVPQCGTYECEELKIRTVTEKYYVGVNVKTKQALVFTPDMIGTYVFNQRYQAVEALKEFRGQND